MEPTLLTREYKKRGVTTKSLYFRTLAMPCLNYFYELFYKDGIKIIPRNLEELLTALTPRRGYGLAFFPSTVYVLFAFLVYYY